MSAIVDSAALGTDGSRPDCSTPPDVGPGHRKRQRAACPACYLIAGFGRHERALDSIGEVLDDEVQDVDFLAQHRSTRQRRASDGAREAGHCSLSDDAVPFN
eukprot:1639079-Rhodomonas_salina.1